MPVSCFPIMPCVKIPELLYLTFVKMSIVSFDFCRIPPQMALFRPQPVLRQTCVPLRQISDMCMMQTVELNLPLRIREKRVIVFLQPTDYDVFCKAAFKKQSGGIIRMDIGSKIRQLRYRASLTQEQLADRLGLSAQAISKWENSVTMPDISLLPLLAETFGISIDELFDLTTEQKYRRIENRMDVQDDLEPDLFREYEDFLKEQIRAGEDSQKAVSVLAHLYHHRLESFARKASACAREAIHRAPEKKDCQWILQKAEGSAPWDWNIANHSKVIDFYKQVIADDPIEPKTPLPYMFLIDNLIVDHRTKEAEEALRIYASLPAHRPFMIPVYEAAIALAAFDEEKADCIMEKALKNFPEEKDLLFEAAQYYARKCDYIKAIQYYEASYKADADHKPRFTDALEGISMIYEILGDYQKAAETQRRILDALKTEWGFSEETVIRETEQEIERLAKRIKEQPSLA